MNIDRQIVIDQDALRPQLDIELFLRVKGRLPTEKGDKLTVEICNEFITKFMKHPVHSSGIGYAFKRLSELHDEDKKNDRQS